MEKIFRPLRTAHNKQRAGQNDNRKNRGFGFVELLIILGMIAILELHIVPYFFRLAYKKEQGQVFDTGKMVSHQLGFMQSRARYQGTMFLSMELTPLGEKYNIMEAFKVKKNIKLQDILLPCINLIGPLKLVFQPLGRSHRETAYTIVSVLLPQYSRRIGVQPVTGRVVTCYE